VYELEASLKRLIGLQECDTRIRELRNKRKQGPMRIQKLQEEFEQSESQLRKELDRLEAYKRERRRIEREIEDPESKIHKSKIKLDNIKSNKEYKAVLKELADLAREKSLLEDQALEVMEQIEGLEKECEASKAKRTELKEKYEKEREAILKELQSVDEALELLEKDRSRFWEAIDSDLLKRYDTLRKRKGGLAVSPVIKGICQTCHMGIPSQKFNELIRCDQLMTCPNCSRIIYWGEDERFQGVPEKEQAGMLE